VTRTLVTNSNFSFLMPWKGVLKSIICFGGSNTTGATVEVWRGVVSNAVNIPILGGNVVNQGPMITIPVPPPSTDAAMVVIPAAPVVVNVNEKLNVGDPLTGTITTGTNIDFVALVFDV